MGSDSATKAAPALRLIERNRPSATCKGTAAWSLPDVSARGRTGSDSNVVGVHDKFSVGGLDMGTIIRNNSRKRMQARSDVPEYLCIYSTQIAGTLLAECISASEWREEHAALQGTEELEWENIQNLHQDPFADIIQREGTTKLRKLDRSIAFALKHLYQYRCQICGELIGEQYGSNLIHAHHIVPFTQSLNNNPENILIVCPNHHGIIHDVNPLYLREKRAFSYPNGFVEPLAINLHL